MDVKTDDQFTPHSQLTGDSSAPGEHISNPPSELCMAFSITTLVPFSPLHFRSGVLSSQAFPLVFSLS
jgi:hypothetical protein